MEKRGELNHKILDQLQFIIDVDPLHDLSSTLQNWAKLYKKSLQQQDFLVNPCSDIE